uniref:EF-hand domain-containing protein n=1 Tax=Steinernema glaseri TaxID=37863 RepID=A0A1I8APS3_9BILA
FDLFAGDKRDSLTAEQFADAFEVFAKRRRLMALGFQMLALFDTAAQMLQGNQHQD